MTVDRWTQWLETRRFGGDPNVQMAMLQQLAARREQLLDLARLAPGESLLDVGCGEGLIAFGALERGAGKVIFSDISEDLLGLCRDAAADFGFLDRAQFVRASADDLGAIASGSVDIVTTRSVLIYVADKARAFREFARVLKPGGRIALFEPINRYGLSTPGYWAGYDFGPLAEIGDRVIALYRELQPPDSDPMLNFDERDLFELAEEAGFMPVTLQLEAQVGPSRPVPWETFLHSAGNPNIPTLEEAMLEVLTPAERERLTTYLRPLVEQGIGRWRMATAVLTATKG